MFWILDEGVKGEIQRQNPRISLDCAESWASHVDWEATNMIIVCLINLRKSRALQKW